MVTIVRKTWTQCLCCSALLFLSGCNSQNVTLVPADGILTIDGQPTGGIMVQFVPDVLDDEIEAPTSQGLSNPDGTFELFTLKNQPGAIEGDHRVSLFDTEEERPEQGEVATRPLRLDPKFSQGQLRVRVVKGQKLNIQATSPR